jgi:hypothetical protein
MIVYTTQGALRQNGLPVTSQFSTLLDTIGLYHLYLSFIVPRNDLQIYFRPLIVVSPCGMWG